MRKLKIFHIQAHGMKFIIIIITAICIIGIASCTGHDVDGRLTQAEMLMDERADSAMSILNSIEHSSIAGDYNKALYGLLITQALDKNHINIPNDSLISSSAAYFERTKDFRHRILAEYYKGRVQYLNGLSQKAIVSFIKSKELADKHQAYFWAGMACRGISDIYCQIYNFTEAEAYAKKEYENIRQSGRQPYLNYAFHDLGRAYCNNGDYEKSLVTVAQLMDSARLYQDEYLKVDAIRLKASCLVAKGDHKKALDFISSVCRSPYAENQDSVLLGYVLMMTGRYDEAEKIANISGTSDGLLKENILYNKYKSLEKYEDAIRILETIDSVSSKTFKSTINNGLTNSLTDYFELNRKLDQSKIDNYKFSFRLIVTGSLFIVLLLVISIMHLRVRYRLKIEEKVNFANQLQFSLNESLDKADRNSVAMRNLHAEKYSLIKELSEIVIHYNDTMTAKKKIAETVTKLIEELSVSSKTIESLEKEIDALYDNLFSDFRRDLPNLKEEDYRLFLFSILGFSNLTISLFLKENNIDAVYNRKRRMKNKINALDENKRDRYLKLLATR